MQNPTIVMPKDVQEKFLGASIEEVVFELARKGDVEGLKDFLPRLPDINVKNEEGTPLIMNIPVNQGFEKYKELLDLIVVKHGADINAQDKDGHTILMGSVAGMFADQTRYELELGANPNIQDEYGQAAVHLAVYAENRQAFVEMLCEAGYSVDLRDKRGKTALMMASSRGDIANVQTLLSYGASPHLKDDNGETAKDVARGSTYQDLEWAEKGILPTRETPRRYSKVAGLDRK